MAEIRQEKISAESAAAQVDELLDYYDVDPKSDMGAAVRSKLIRYYQRGDLEHLRDDKGRIKIRQHLREAPGAVSAYEYGALTGAARVAMDTYNPQEFYQRLHALMGGLSGLGEAALLALTGRDRQVMETLAQVFLLG